MSLQNIVEWTYFLDWCAVRFNCSQFKWHVPYLQLFDYRGGWGVVVSVLGCHVSAVQRQSCFADYLLTGVRNRWTVKTC